MKKILLLLSLILTLVFIGCDKDSDSPTAPVAERTNVEKVTALLNNLKDGKTDAIVAYVSETNYIQHNLGSADGRQALIDGITSGAFAGAKVNVKRIFADGNFVFVHTDYFLFGQKMVGFDIFRFENGKIVEHWDNLAAGDASVTDPVNGHTLVDGVTAVTDLDKTEANRTLVKNFYQNVIIGGAWSTYANYISSNYIQHDEGSPNGSAIFTQLPDGFSMATSMKFVYAQGNFVLAGGESSDIDSTTGNPTSQYNLWRVENGKLIEHWGIYQPIAKRDDWKNTNGKFTKPTDKEIVTQFYTKCLTINPGETQAVAKSVMNNLFAADFQSINTNGVTPASDISNKQGMIDGVIGMRGLIPNLKWEALDTRQVGNRVIVRSKATGSTKGEFLGLNLPTAKPFNIMTIDIHTVENGRIKTVYHTEEWSTAIAQLTTSKGKK